MDYPTPKPGQELVICRNGCGAYYVTQYDRGFDHWVCPACELAQLDHYYTLTQETTRHEHQQHVPEQVSQGRRRGDDQPDRHD